MLVYGVILVVVGLLFVRLPSSFLPEEDQGYFLNVIMLPKPEEMTGTSLLAG